MRSTKEKKELEIFAIAEKGKKAVARILDDFVLEEPQNLPKRVEIRNLIERTLGFVETFYPKREEIQVLSKRGTLISRLKKEEDYLEIYKKVIFNKTQKRKFRVISGVQASFREDIGAGIKKVYSFGKTKVYYFEKNDEVAIVVKDEKRFLEFLPLLIAERVWQQEEIKKLLV